MAILDQHGKPIYSDALQQARQQVRELRRQILKVTASYDAAKTVTGNVNHWANADHLDPHSSNSAEIRRVLRSRSRYEVVENNPYLKGIFLTICNDFVGSGPKLQITDHRWKSKTRRQNAERKWTAWAKCIKLRDKLWRMRMAKGVDGESFLLPFYNYRRANYRFSSREDILLDFYLPECERCDGPSNTGRNDGTLDLEGVRFDENNVPIAYHFLNYNPGSSLINQLLLRHRGDGRWHAADYVVHWFRQDREWLRGVPETTTCLPLCALLRRYTLAVVRSAEIAAAFSAVLETDGPAGTGAWTDGQGNLIEDDPFDTFPFELGMITTMPWGYKLNQMKAEQPTTMYDEFVAALLREITRPLLVPYNIASGTSKDSNMASAVVDTHIYKTGHEAERHHCEEYVLDKILAMWWEELYFTDRATAGDRGVPEHRWRWDAVGLDHTDPVKVATALQIYRQEGILTDKDIQEGRFNRDYEEWQEDIEEAVKFREKVGLSISPDTDKVAQAEQQTELAQQGMDHEEAALEEQQRSNMASEKQAAKAATSAKKTAAKKESLNTKRSR